MPRSPMSYYRDGYLYDLLDGQDFSQEKLEFFLSFAPKPPAHVVDVGCGTGLYSLAMAREGFYVTGLDLADAMLAYGKEKLAREPLDVQQRVTFLRADMQTFTLEQPADFVTVLGQSFLHMLTFEDQSACLKNIHQHLVSQGRLVLEFRTEAFYAETMAGKFQEPSCWYAVTDPNTGHRLESWGQVECFPEQKKLTLNRTIKEVNEAGTVVSVRQGSLSSVVLSDHELNHLAEVCGFTIVQQFGSHQGEALQDDSSQAIYVLEARN